MMKYIIIWPVIIRYTSSKAITVFRKNFMTLDNPIIVSNPLEEDVKIQDDDLLYFRGTLAYWRPEDLESQTKYFEDDTSAILYAELHPSENIQCSTS